VLRPYRRRGAHVRVLAHRSRSFFLVGIGEAFTYIGQLNLFLRERLNKGMMTI
jgi:hypothetical protein